jgi:hypothetical protein
MKIKEILEIESNNGGVINLFLEGIFWKAYEQSAYLFSANVEAFAINKKMIKNVQKEIVSLGFNTAYRSCGWFTAAGLSNTNW